MFQEMDHKAEAWDIDNALILIAEDDPDIRLILRSYLERDGLRVVTANDGSEALMQHSAIRPDLVLLDINMPKLDGFEVIRKIREKDNTPIIFISARSDDADKLSGLGYGADDYVVKPFNPKEVVARTLAVLRRTNSNEPPSLLRHDRLEVDQTTGMAFVTDGEEKSPLSLTPSEFRLLAHMIQAPTRVYSRFDLLEACFPDSEALERTVDSHVSNLRKKLTAAGADGHLSVMRGVGYRLSR